MHGLAHRGKLQTHRDSWRDIYVKVARRNNLQNLISGGVVKESPSRTFLPRLATGPFRYRVAPVMVSDVRGICTSKLQHRHRYCCLQEGVVCLSIQNKPCQKKVLDLEGEKSTKSRKMPTIELGEDLAIRQE